MGVTISTHNGSTVAREHNIRNERVTSKEKHIDMLGVHEIWHDEKVRDAYERLFGKSQREYNERQKRDDRKIKSYYNDVCKDAKKHPVYEMIIGVYGRDEEGETICSEEQGKAIMKDFVNGWKERNPNLEMIGAYYHADEEGEPHVHIDYIPVAHGYSRGMETQTGLVKALGEMGFEKQGKLTAQIQWEARENKVLDEICREYGLEVDHPKEENRKHISTEQYKAEKSLDKAIENAKELLDIQDDLRAETGKLEATRDKANKQTQKALERKARAVKLHKNKDGQGWTYDEGLVRGIKDITKDIKNDVKAIGHTDLEIERQYDVAKESRIKAQEEAERTKRLAEEELKKAQEYKNNQEDYIIKMSEIAANKIFNEFIKEEFEENMQGKAKRLEEFCEDIKFQDGSSVLDKFNKVEIERKHSLERSWNDEWNR